MSLELARHGESTDGACECLGVAQHAVALAERTDLGFGSGREQTWIRDECLDLIIYPLPEAGNDRFAAYTLAWIAVEHVGLDDEREQLTNPLVRTEGVEELLTLTADDWLATAVYEEAVVAESVDGAGDVVNAVVERHSACKFTLHTCDECFYRLDNHGLLCAHGRLGSVGELRLAGEFHRGFLGSLRSDSPRHGAEEGLAVDFDFDDEFGGLLGTGEHGGDAVVYHGIESQFILGETGAVGIAVGGDDAVCAEDFIVGKELHSLDRMEAIEHEWLQGCREAVGAGSRRRDEALVIEAAGDFACYREAEAEFGPCLRLE